MTTVLVYETCACGTEVPRKLFFADSEPRTTATQVVWCPNCRNEVGTCEAKGCPEPASARANSLRVCRYHETLARLAGMET